MGFHLNPNPYPVVATLRSRSPSLSMASSNDPPEVPSGPRRWDEDIVHLLGDLEGSKLFRKHLERHQLLLEVPLEVPLQEATQLRELGASPGTGSKRC